MCTVHVKPALCLHCPAYNKGMHMSDAEPFWLLQVNAENVHTPFASAALSSATSLLCQLTTSQACEGSGFHSRSVQLHRLLSSCCAEANLYADSKARATTSHETGCTPSGGILVEPVLPSLSCYHCTSD